MRESCEAFRQAQIIKPYLKKCPDNEVQIIRPPSGHGGKVCEPCSSTNRIEQRKRESAQKRARRAKLKRHKMTAGIGAGNVVWTAPTTWRASVVDGPTLALHSPQPRRLNTFNVRLMAQAHQYELNGSISTATTAQNYVNVSQQERGVYSPSSQLFTATTSRVLQPQENGHDRVATEMRDETNLYHQYKTKTQGLPTATLDTPVYQEQQRQPVGLGISIADDVKWGQDPPETCSLNQWSFRKELEQWSIIFEEDNDVFDDARSFGEG